MPSSLLKSSARISLSFVVVALAAACIVPAPVQTTVQPAPVVYQSPQPVQTTVYQPQYYNGNVVYFDTRGYPFYYLNGATTYVPRSCTCFEALVSHYRTYSSGYAQWYAEEGARMISLGLNLGL